MIGLLGLGMFPHIARNMYADISVAGSSTPLPLTTAYTPGPSQSATQPGGRHMLGFGHPKRAAELG